VKPPIVVFVSFGLALASASANASAPPEQHRLQPNAPRSVTVTEADTPPVIRAGLLQSTLILLPVEEKIANHLLTADFPPMLVGLRYDLTNSVSAEVWPNRIAAGTAELNLTPPVPIGDLLFRVCNGIRPLFDINSIHV
jgi:hypothetical protein